MKRTIELGLFFCCIYLCACSRTTSSLKDGGTLPVDDATADELSTLQPCGDTTCAADQVCFDNQCVGAAGSCGDAAPCLNDRFCYQGRCLAYGEDTRLSDPSCQTSGGPQPPAPFALDAFANPITKCLVGGEAVAMAPVVADLDGDAFPEIVFSTYAGELVAVRATGVTGDPCVEVFRRKPAGVVWHGCHLAVGDLDGDGRPEIVAAAGGNEVLVADHRGNTLAISEGGGHGVIGSHHGPAIANVDGQGGPEIVYGGLVLRYDSGQLTTVTPAPKVDVPEPGGKAHGVISVVADVDLDGHLEILTGNKIYDGSTGLDKTPQWSAAGSTEGVPPGHAAVAQLDPGTAQPEIILVGDDGNLRVFSALAQTEVLETLELDQAVGGPPVVADFDGDGEPEVGTCGATGYALFDWECVSGARVGRCQEDGKGVRWSKAVQDESIHGRGSTAFDFNGDGLPEVVYHDECWLRIYDGKTGQVLAAKTCRAKPGLDLPVVADVDNDGRAELVVACDATGAGPCKAEAELGLSLTDNEPGLYVLEDPKDRWMSARTIWNQHTYHISNVQRDGSIPSDEPRWWNDHNSFRQQTAAKDGAQADLPAPDLTARWHSDSVDPATNCDDTWVLLADVCNRGAQVVPAGLAGVFYQGDPRAGGELICQGETMVPLDPQECAVVQCTWEGPAVGQIDLWFWADVGGDGVGRTVECQEENNLFHVSRIKCPGIID